MAWLFCAVILLRGEMLVLIVKLKYKVQHCKRLNLFGELLETIAVTMDSTALAQRRSSA